MWDFHPSFFFSPPFPARTLYNKIRLAILTDVNISHAHTRSRQDKCSRPLDPPSTAAQRAVFYGIEETWVSMPCGGAVDYYRKNLGKIRLWLASGWQEINLPKVFNFWSNSHKDAQSKPSSSVRGSKQPAFLPPPLPSCRSLRPAAAANSACFRERSPPQCRKPNTYCQEVLYVSWPPATRGCDSSPPCGCNELARAIKAARGLVFFFLLDLVLCTRQC